MSGVLDQHGRLVSRLRGELNRVRLRNQAGPLLERLAHSEKELRDSEAAQTDPRADADDKAGAGAGDERRSAAATGGAPGDVTAAATTEEGGAVVGGSGGGERTVGAAEAAAARRLMADAMTHIADLQQQLAVEGGLRDKAELELQEMRQLFDSYVQSTVAQVQSMSGP